MLKTENVLLKLVFQLFFAQKQTRYEKVYKSCFMMT